MLWAQSVWVPLAPALVGIAGISGTLIASFFGPIWTSDRIVERDSKRAFRNARRLVADELEHNGTALNSIANWIEKGRGTVPPVKEHLPTTRWEAHEETIASSVDEKVWLQVRYAYQLIRVQGHQLALEIESDKIEMATLRQVEERVKDASKILERAEYSPVD